MEVELSAVEELLAVAEVCMVEFQLWDRFRELFIWHILHRCMF